MVLPSGVMWRQSPLGQITSRLLQSSGFWVALALSIDMLLVLTLGHAFGGSGSQPVFNPACRTDNARLYQTPLDLVIMWEVRCINQDTRA